MTAAIAAPPYELMQKAVTNPGNFWSLWGSAKNGFISAPGLKGGVAQRITIATRPGKPWDVGIYTKATKPVKKGDVLLLMFWARVDKPPPGSDLVLLSGRIYEEGAEHGEVSQETNFLIGNQWRPYYVKAKAAKDYPVGTLSAGLVIGMGEMVIDFGPVTIFDFGPNYNVNMLPRN